MGCLHARMHWTARNTRFPHRMWCLSDQLQVGAEAAEGATEDTDLALCMLFCGMVCCVEVVGEWGRDLSLSHP